MSSRASSLSFRLPACLRLKPCRNCVAGATRQNSSLSRSSPLIVFDAPSKPSEHLTRRSARLPHSLTEYYTLHRRVHRPPASQQPSSTTATSASSSSSGSTTGEAAPVDSTWHNDPATADDPRSQTFDSPSKPREYYVRPQRKRDLPELSSRLPMVLLLTILSLSTWGAFVLYATNMERVSSSVVRQLCANLKSIASVKEALGDDVAPEAKWWLRGEPWIDGAVNLLQGHVDLSFRVRGSKGGGTLYFTSVREEKGKPFTILRSKIICDDGTILRLLDN